MKLIYIKSPLDIEDQNAITSLLKQNSGEKIASRVFKLKDPVPVQSYLKKKEIDYETYHELIELKKYSQKELIAAYKVIAVNQHTQKEVDVWDETINDVWVKK